MATKKLDPRCKALARSGKRCRAAATAGGLCFFHANPDKASELGRIGGRKKRHTAHDDIDLPSLNTALAVRDTVTRLVADVYAGNVHPRIASSLASLMNLQLRAIETTDLEQRVEKLEKKLAEVESPVLDPQQRPELSLDGLPGFGDVNSKFEPDGEGTKGPARKT